jgi:tartrate-resistant acid phosphatase type 5
LATTEVFKEETKAVSNLVKNLDPDFIITTGDNIYGENDNMNDVIGGLYGNFLDENNIFPCLGNHDFDKETKKPNRYFDYFKFIDEQYYYDFVKGSVHFFSVCSDPRCPDGIDPESKQMLWLKEKIQESKLPWKIVYFHHPSYSSIMVTPSVGKWESEKLEKNSQMKINLPFGEWGVSAVLSGHLHVYERFDVAGVPYIINGLGGDSRYEFDDENSKSLKRFSEEDGVMFVEDSNESLHFKFITTSEKVVDEFILKK